MHLKIRKVFKILSVTKTNINGQRYALIRIYFDFIWFD